MIHDSGERRKFTTGAVRDIAEGATKRTLEEWQRIKKIKIIDPDGFDRTDPKLNERLFTEKEFDKGLIRWTITSPERGR